MEKIHKNELDMNYLCECCGDLDNKAVQEALGTLEPAVIMIKDFLLMKYLTLNLI